MEAMIDAEVASGLDAAFKTKDAFIEYLLGDYRVGTELDGRRAGRLDGWSWNSCCRCRGLS